MRLTLRLMKLHSGLGGRCGELSGRGVAVFGCRAGWVLRRVRETALLEDTLHWVPLQARVSSQPS